MHSIIRTLIFLSITISVCQAHRLFRRDATPQTGELSRAALQFSLDLLNKIATRENKENVVYSPWSIFTTLNMLHLGLSDTTQSERELNRLLSITPETKLARHEAMSRISKEMSTGPVTDLASSELKFIQANKVLFNQKIVKLNQNYASNLAKNYDASIEPFVLGKPNEFPVHERVNEWVKNTTYGMIQNITDSSLASNPNLALVLLNAAYFKGQWLNIFNNTKIVRFFNNGDKEADVDAMFMEIKPSSGVMFDYGEFGRNRRHDEATAKTEEEKKLDELTQHLNCSVLSLPYNLNGGKDFSMVLILPDRIAGMDGLQSDLNPQVLEAMLKSLKSTSVSIAIPKFEFETSLEVPSYLKSMQVNSIFQASHDFKGMFDSDKQFAVDKITHKSKIKVDEKGTEAAGATMVTVFKKTATPGPMFVANHPFIFIIRHNKSNIPLFMGRVNKVKFASRPKFPWEQ